VLFVFSNTPNDIFSVNINLNILVNFIWVYFIFKFNSSSFPKRKFIVNLLSLYVYVICLLLLDTFVIIEYPGIWYVYLLKICFGFKFIDFKVKSISTFFLLLYK
jgi:hypothetical protein